MAGNNDYTFVIGLDSSQFDSGLKETQRKLKAAMEQFEREKSLVKIRADIDIAGLDATTDKTKILEIQEKALNDTLDLQRQKLQAASAAYNLTAEIQGKQAASAQKLELAMEKERLKVVQLEKELEKLERSATDVAVDIKVDDSRIDIPKIEVPEVEIKVNTSGAEKEIRNAGKKINSEIDKLSREQTLIQLRGQVQLEGLDESASIAEKVKLQETALTAQIDLQKEKIALLSKSYTDLVQAQGQNSDAAQIMAVQLEKEQLAMLRLQQQTADLSKQQEIALGINWEMLGLIEPAIKGIDQMIAAGRTIPIPHAKVAAAAAVALSAIAVGTKEATDELRENNPAQILAEDFKDIEPDIAESFARISDGAARTSQDIRNSFEESAENVSSSLETTADSYTDYFDDALSIIEILIADTENLGDALGVVNDRLPYFKTETGRIAAIGVGLKKTFDELSESAIKFAQPAVDGFKEVREQANELYLSLSKAQEIGSFINLSGGEYDDVRDYIRGIQDAVIKGGGADDPEVLALEKYGVTIQDAKGHLLEFDEALENVYQGYLKAKEAGEAEAYIIMTNGQSIHDVATFLENYGKAKERANQIKWSTSDFASLAELSTNLKMAEVQAGEFESALSGLAVPLANLAAESKFEFFKTITGLIEENRDTILLWEFAAIETFKSGKQALIDFADSAIDKIKELNDSFGITDKIKGFIGSLDETFGVTDKFKDLLSSDTQTDKDSIWDKARKDLDAYNAANETSREITKKNIKDAEALSYSLNRITKYKQEIADLKIDLQFGDNEYQKSLARLEQWREEVLKDARYYEDEQNIIAEEYALKRQQIEQQHNEEIEQINKETADIIYEATHSEFEKQLRDIEEWKDAQLEKAATAEDVATTITNAALKETQAFEREMDRIKGNTQSLQEKIFEQTHSQREVDIMRAQKQRDELLKDNPAEVVDQWYQNELSLIRNRSRGNYRYKKRPKLKEPNFATPDFWRDIQQDTTDIAQKYADDTGVTEKLNNALKSLEESATKLPQNFNSLDSVNAEITRTLEQTKDSFTELSGTSDSLNQSFQAVKDAGDILGDTFGKMVKNISENSEKLSKLQSTQKDSGSNKSLNPSKLQPATTNDNSDLINQFLDGTQTVGKIISLLGAVIEAGSAGAATPAAVPMMLGGAGLEILADIAQQVYNATSDSAPTTSNAPTSSKDFQQKIQDFNSAENLPTFEAFNFGLENATSALDSFSNSLLNFNAPAGDNLPQIDTSIFNQMTQQLSELTQTAGIIAQNAKENQKQQPPTINITVNPNINLGGAYVFDNAMKNQLTNDITDNVANAVTSAVQSATSKSNYGYSA